MKSKILGLIAVGLLGGPVVANAAMLVGLSTSSPGNLYSIDPTTGAATLLVEVNGASGTSLVGLEALGGKLYATDVLASEFNFGTIDMGTGTFTTINDQGGSFNWHGLAANEGAGLFYTIDLEDGNKLKSVTIGGVITTIGSGAGIDGRGLAYDDALGVLYGTFESSLYRVDITTGTSTLIGAFGVDSLGYVGLAFDEMSRSLFMNLGTSLYSLNTLTGAATLIGANSAPYQIDGLAWVVAVPEPGTLTLLGLGLAGLGLSRRRKAS